jgi:hypothetical protein
MLFMAGRLGIPAAGWFDVLVVLDDDELVPLPAPVVEVVCDVPDRGPHGFGNGWVFSVPACPFRQREDLEPARITKQTPGHARKVVY